MVPPLAPGVLAARNKEMRHRLSTSSVVLGALGQDMRDWTLSSIQPPPLVRGTSNPMQREINLTRKKGVEQLLPFYCFTNSLYYGRLSAMKRTWAGHLPEYECGVVRTNGFFYHSSIADSWVIGSVAFSWFMTFIPPQHFRLVR